MGTIFVPFVVKPTAFSRRESAKGFIHDSSEYAALKAEANAPALSAIAYMYGDY
jgi:hypothetical protein